MTRIASLAVALVAVLLALDGPSLPVQRTEVVVLLESPPLARAPGGHTAIAGEQRVFRQELAARLPAAEIGWRYRFVANGFSLSLPSSELPRLRTVPGVRDVLPAGSYAPQLSATPHQIGAPALWGQGLDTAGQGVKIGIIDSGIDAGHPFFDPTGYAMPAGFPKGQERFTTAKVIVARVFAPKSVTAASARVAFSDDDSSHGTHVAGIAAGNADTPAGGGRRVSGVAPRAYLGNYKVFVQTDSGLSPNANSPAIVAAIEAAVADGMNVINFSGGEPEIEPSRDIVARALDAAAAAGVVSVVAAGNDYNDFGAGSVASPANAEGAIAVGAVEIGGSPTTRIHAEFSSVGPTTISLRLKPDVAAPGVDVLSSVPGGWSTFSGTSMAAPHIAGSAALLRQRHPSWSAEQVKSALVQSGVDALEARNRSAGPRFQGGGVVALVRADQPLLFARPTALSFGLLERGRTATNALALEDAGGGAGSWKVEVVTRARLRGVRVVVPPAASVPGPLSVTLSAAARATAGDVDAYIELRRGGEVRRIPLWGRVSASALAKHRVGTLLRPGVYRSTTATRPALVSRYRYPEAPSGIGVTTTLRGPERVFRFRIAKRVANAGVVITQQRSRVEPRMVAALDENRLTGYAGLPVNRNPYMDGFHESVLAAGVLSPLPGEYAVVFDSAARTGAGPFTFRYWVNDVLPPVLRLRTPSVAAGESVLVSATDAGAGVYPESIRIVVDGSSRSGTLRGGLLSISTGGLSAGTHRLRLRVSDYQESKNTENVARILPNTRTATFAFRVR